ncbi:hypothetical protein NKH18_02720 [Streptomyces sp. M10(2022)]
MAWRSTWSSPNGAPRPCGPATPSGPARRSRPAAETPGAGADGPSGHGPERAGLRRVPLRLPAPSEYLPRRRGARWAMGTVLAAAVAVAVLAGSQGRGDPAPEAAAPARSPAALPGNDAAHDAATAVITVRAADDVYVLAPGGVYRWQGHGTMWTKIGERARSIHAGPAGVFVADPGGRLLVYGGTPGVWRTTGSREPSSRSAAHMYTGLRQTVPQSTSGAGGAPDGRPQEARPNISTAAERGCTPSPRVTADCASTVASRETGPLPAPRRPVRGR